jgi:hypothetical protein
MQATEEGWLPLHLASKKGHTAVVQQLLAAAAEMPMQATQTGILPLHLAAQSGHTAVMQHLLAAAPKAAMHATRAGLMPLQLALQHGDGGPHFAAASLLLHAAAAPRQLDLTILLAAGPRGLHLLADYVIARMPLSTAEWERIPAPCPGLLHALPAALTRSADQAREVVQRLSPSDAAQLRTALQCLQITQRRCGVFLLPDLVLNVLQIAYDPDV